MARDDFHVMVIGAGSAGLLLAQRLKMLGIKCTVYEREAYLNERSRDWSFGIYWAHDALHECLPTELKDKLATAQVDPSFKPSKDEVIPFLNAETGEILQRIPAPFLYRLARGKFRGLVSTGIKIEFGKRLSAISNSSGGKALAMFEDGSEAVGDLIVGADGAHSKVRDSLLGPEKAALHSLPLVGSSIITTLPAALATKFRDTIDPIIALSYHPLGMLAFVSLHAVEDHCRPETWLWMLHLGWRSDTSEALPQVEDMNREWQRRSLTLFEPLRSMFLSVPSDLKYPCDRLAQWPTVAWDNREGKVTLTGDAAHPMTYHRGQGLNNAATDAANLGNAIREHVESRVPIEEALAKYEAEIVKRGNQAVIDNGNNSLQIHEWDRMREAQVYKSGFRPDIKE